MTTRRRGRPRKRDPETIADAAMQVFWSRGYAATSITDLTASTGAHPGGIYAGFGNKRGLFLAALRRYSAHGRSEVSRTLRSSTSPLEGLRTYLRAQLDLAWSPAGSRGCLIANTTLEMLPGPDDVAAIVHENFTEIHRELADRVLAAQRAGELTERWPAEIIATQLLALVEGVLVLGRTANDPTLLEAALELTIGSLAP